MNKKETQNYFWELVEYDLSKNSEISIIKERYLNRGYTDEDFQKRLKDNNMNFRIEEEKIYIWKNNEQ